MLAIWSAPKEPSTLMDKIRAMRITIRHNYNPVFVLKKGTV